LPVANRHRLAPARVARLHCVTMGPESQAARRAHRNEKGLDQIGPAPKLYAYTLLPAGSENPERRRDYLAKEAIYGFAALRHALTQSSVWADISVVRAENIDFAKAD
jgi:hypothetical protein